MEKSPYYSQFEQQLAGVCCGQTPPSISALDLSTKMREISYYLSVHDIAEDRTKSFLPEQLSDDPSYKNRLAQIRRHYHNALDQLEKAQSDSQIQRVHVTVGSAMRGLPQFLERCEMDGQQKSWTHQKYTIMRMTADAVTRLRSAHVPARRRRNLRPHATTVRPQRHFARCLID